MTEELELTIPSEDVEEIIELIELKGIEKEVSRNLLRSICELSLRIITEQLKNGKGFGIYTEKIPFIDNEDLGEREAMLYISPFEEEHVREKLILQLHELRDDFDALTKIWAGKHDFTEEEARKRVDRVLWDCVCAVLCSLRYTGKVSIN